MEESRMSRRSQNNNSKGKKNKGKRPKKKKSLAMRIFLTLFIIILVLIGAAAAFAAKVYFDVSGSVKETYTPVVEQRQRTEYAREKEVNLDKKEPFSVLLMGIDTGDLGRVDQGRSDTLMVATVNPETNKTTLVSIPRDSYVDIVGYGTTDKINHAYAFGGAAMSMDTVENFLQIPIDHYVSINMAGVKELVDAVGGISVNNDLEFNYEGNYFPFGQINLDGAQALAFSRMRYEDPRGDYGRQLRQRLVVEGVAKKGLSLGGISQYQNILNTLEGNMQTDLTFADMQDIGLKYSGAFGTFDQLQMQGEGTMINGISYQLISDEELSSVQQALRTELNLSN